MHRILILLLLIYSSCLLAKGNNAVDQSITSVQISRMLDESQNTQLLIDLIHKEEKVSECIQEYVKKQSKSYSKIAQENLYGLIHNFDSIMAKIYGKKGLPDDISYNEKIELLAQVQCDTYYKMGILK
jgi:hypothetical protein